MFEEKKFELSICIPIWYGAKTSDFERCLDSLYTSLEKINDIYNDKKIKIIIGIDNTPINHKETSKKKNNVKEIKSRIDIFKNALIDLKNSKNIVFEYFITEFNVKVSVMRNIMISKSIDAKYINFIDGDDEIEENAINIMLKNILIAFQKNIKSLYFKTFSKTVKINRFESIGVWGSLFDTSFLLKNNISFIPGIPMEDRFFRREVELYSIEEEQANIYETIYLHNQEAGSGFLEKDSQKITRQESFKRLYYSNLKIKTYSSIKRGFDEMFYKEINYFINFENISDKDVDEYMINFFNNDKHISKDEILNYKFPDRGGLFDYQVENHFTLCKITNDKNETEIYCRGYLTNGDIKIENIDTFNQIINSLGLESIKLLKLLPYFLENKNLLSKNIIEKLEEIRNNDILSSIKNKNYDKLLNILEYDRDIDLQTIDLKNLDEKSLKIIEKYAFTQAYIAILKEDIEKLNFLLNKFPNIVNLKNEYNINLANISCRRQTIEDNLMNSIKSKIIKDKNDIIIILLSKSPNSFKEKDIYNKSALTFLLREYSYGLTTNNENFTENDLNNFLYVVEKLINVFKDNSYKLVQLFRYIYYELKNKKDKKITDILEKIKNGEVLDLNEQEDFLEELYTLRINYNSDILINENIYIALQNKDYKRIKDLLMIREESLYKKLGSQEGQEKPEIIYIKFSTIKSVFNYINKENKTLLDYIDQDDELKKLIEDFLKETIFLNLINDKIKIEPMNSKVVSRTKFALEILFNKKYNFKNINLSFDDFLEKYFNKSNILKNAKIIVETKKNIKNIKKHNLNKNILKELEKINNEDNEKTEEINNLIENIESIKAKKDLDINKIIELLNLFEEFAKNKESLNN